MIGKKKIKTWQMILIALLIIVVGSGIGAYIYSHHMLDKIKKIDVNKDELGIVNVDGYVNILIMGVDSRDMKNIKGSRTDAMILVSIEEKTNKVKLTSIYRDTMLKIGDSDKYDKTTHAFAYGGHKATVKTLNQSLDLNIDQFVVINWKSVIDTINAAGGITLDIEDYEIDEMNACTAENAAVVGNGKYTPITQPGKQTVDGYQAVGYGRMRNGVGDDFKRNDRMRIVIESLLNKLKKSSLGTIDKVLKKALPLIQTNISNSDILSLAARIPKYKIEQSAGFPYHLTGGLIDGVYYIIPDDLEKNVRELHHKLFGKKDYVPSNKVMSISNRIIELTGRGKYDVDPTVVPPAPVEDKEPKDNKVEETDSYKPEVPSEPSPSPTPEPTPTPGPTPSVPEPEKPDSSPSPGSNRNNQDNQ
ncbi:LCP family protein [Eubacteriales bacterium KG127]